VRRGKDLLLAGLVVLSLLLAAAIYLGARSGLRMHAWASPAEFFVSWLRGFLTGAPAWVRFNLPDALWQFAFCVVLFRLWRDRPPSVEKNLFCTLPLAIGAGTELGQAAGVIEGVFDAKDLAGMLLAALVAFLLVGRSSGHKNHQSTPASKISFSSASHSASSASIFPSSSFCSRSSAPISALLVRSKNPSSQ
jgi:hypothetical protein